MQRVELVVASSRVAVLGRAKGRVGSACRKCRGGLFKLHAREGGQRISILFLKSDSYVSS